MSMETSQCIFLDFDGAFTSYHGELLEQDAVTVADSGLDTKRINAIVAALNDMYAASGVQFVTSAPAAGEFSTIYVGKTNAFDAYGSFAGISETLDSGNLNRSDNAFVLLDSASTDDEIISTISHEAGHLLGENNHGGEGLNAYGAVVFTGTPDLSVSDYNVSASSITTAESVKLTFKVSNTGNGDAAASTIKIYDGETLIREVALDSVAAGTSRNCTVTIPAGKLPVGSRKVYVVVDANNTVDESNENNNRAYRTINVTQGAQPDLRMAEYSLSSNSITTQESVKLTFKVYNDGEAKAPASTIKVYDGDKLLREVALGEIDAKGYRNCTITLVAGKLSVGTHKVNVVLDSENIIAESSETNNNSYRTIFVKEAAAKPDLRMEEISLSSNSITTQESVKLTFKVYNDGEAKAPASTIKVYDGDKLLREVALGEIDAKGYRNCTITLVAGKLSVGTHRVNVVLDSENIIAESSETNNNSYRTIFVKEPVRSLATAPKENNDWNVSAVDTLCGGSYSDLGGWSLENTACLTRSAADNLTVNDEENRLLSAGKLA